MVVHDARVSLGLSHSAIVETIAPDAHAVVISPYEPTARDHSDLRSPPCDPLLPTAMAVVPHRRGHRRVTLAPDAPRRHPSLLDVGVDCCSSCYISMK